MARRMEKSGGGAMAGADRAEAHHCTRATPGNGAGATPHARGAMRPRVPPGVTVVTPGRAPLTRRTTLPEATPSQTVCASATALT
jgi:hypothetical protein